MKKILLASFATALCLQAEAQTFAHAPVPVTGFTDDVIADGSGAATSSTTADIDGENYNLVAQNFVNPTNQTPVAFLPTGGLISSLATAGLNFQLQPYTANNTLRITTTNSTGTLTLTTPRTADQLNLLITSAYGATFTATVNFSDGTTEAFTSNVVPNWFDGTVATAAKTIGRVLRTTNAIENPANNPRLYQYTLALSAANKTKNIQSITFTKTTTGVKEVMHVFAVTASTAIPNDAGVSAITAPGATVVPGVSTPVSVTVKNYGASPLTAATLGFSVNGTTVLNNFAYTDATGLATNAVSAPVTIGNFSFPFGVSKVKAWSTLPNSAADGLKANDTTQVNVIACNALSGNYTIDKSSAASATNFTSFASVIQILSACGVSGPVVFNIANGTGPYNEQVVLPAITGASAINTITFNGNGNTLVNPTSSGDALKLNGAKYFRFNNLKVEAASGATSGSVVSLIGGAENNTFNGCTFTHSITSTSSSQPVYVNAGSSNNTFQNNTLIGGYYGIYNSGASATLNNNNQFIGNTIKDPYYYGIYNYYGPGTLIEGNDISRMTRTNGSTLYGIYNTTGGTGVTISKNRIHNTHDAAASTTGSVFGIYSGVAGTLGSENLVKNNAIYNINNAGGTFYAFYNSGGNNTYYYHNTVSADNSSISYSNLRGVHFASASTNVKFNNNNISLGSTATSGKHAIYLGSTTIALESKTNNLYAPNGNVGYYSANKATLADWKTANSGVYDQASVSVDPQYVGLATGNLKPANVGMDNIGLPITPAVTDDITGTVRSTTTPDPGAYEITQAAAAADAGVTAISSVVSGCNLSNQETISITVNNFGTTAQSNIPVSYTINGGTPVNETFAGPLAPGTSATYSFTTKANLSAPATYSIVASTALTGDALATNDAFTKVVVSSAPAAVPTVTAGGPVSFCTGGSVTLTAVSATTGATYAWYNNGTLIPGATSATYNATTAGSYTAVASLGTCASAQSTATAVTVNTAPAVPTVTTGGPTSFCTGGSVLLTAASTTTGATYAWYNNGTLIPGATSATYTATAAGNYTAVASVGTCASAQSTATAVTVNAAPAVPTLTAGGATTFCSGGSVTLTAASTTTGATYTWSLNGTPISGASSATYTATVGGNYTAMATSGTCTATSTATTVTVNATPATPTIAQNGTVLTSSSASGNQWYLNGSPISGATAATYNTTANGSYTVVVTDNGCSSAASSAVTITNTGLKDAVLATQVNVFPNPSNGIFNVELPKGKTYELLVTDLAGKVLKKQSAKGGNNQLNLEGTTKGIYLLKVSGENGTAVRKLNVE